MLNKTTPDTSFKTNSDSSDSFQSRSVAVAKGSAMALFRPILALLGVFFIVIGVPIAFLTPIPFVPIGLPIVILGVVLLARNSLVGRRWMKATIAKHPRLKKFAPNWLLKLILGEQEVKPEDETQL